jgi:(S)-2-hydroxyglutarate dehydrogenase
MKYDYLVIGGGLVGLATALAIRKKFPNSKLAVLEKEEKWATHQSVRNSGVTHAGVYYKPGSKKAKFAHAGNRSMFEFCEAYGIPNERCGKLIVATQPEQLAALDKLRARALANQVSVKNIGAEEAKELEPHVKCVGALHVSSTGIVDFKMVAAQYVILLDSGGVDLLLGQKVIDLKEIKGGYHVQTSVADFETKYLISCVGLYSDRVATKAKADPEMKIVPFRGEYWHLRSSKSYLVKNLIYPVPNPQFPFLGVHLTRLIDGSIHAGPNAVLAASREGYSWSVVNGRDLFETFTYPGFWKLAKSYYGEGLREIYRSLSKAAFLKSVQQLIPEIQSRDLIRGESGVRAQSVQRDGNLIDDFHLIQKTNAIFVLNAPSPAATASLEIGRHIAQLINS